VKITGKCMILIVADGHCSSHHWESEGEHKKLVYLAKCQNTSSETQK